MTVRHAQLLLLWLSLANIVLIFSVLISGRFWGFPLDYELNEEIPLVQLATPPLFSVIASAVYFIQHPQKVVIEEDQRGLVASLICATNLLFFLGFSLISGAFYFANRPGSDAVFGLDAYRLWMTILLSLLTLTIPGLNALVFKRK